MSITEVEKALKKEMEPSGFSVESVIKALQKEAQKKEKEKEKSKDKDNVTDNDNDKEINIINAEKAGKDELEAMLQSIRETEKNAVDSILSGDIRVEPYVYGGNEKGCDYCPFGSVCGFDKKIKGYKYRNIRKS